MLCNCPLPAAIPDFPTDDCFERLGEIQRFGITRLKNGAVLNEIVIGTDDPALLATWTALKSATDSTKYQFSPYIQEPVHEAGEKREYGGEGQTLNGVPIILGSQPSPFDAAFLDIKQTIAVEMRKLMCERELGVILINEHNQIISKTDDPANPTVLRPIPIWSFFLSDKRMGMYAEPDKNFVSWMFKQGWADNLMITTPTDFDALTEL